jgi:hypothetical protein
MRGDEIGGLGIKDSEAAALNICSGRYFGTRQVLLIYPELSMPGLGPGSWVQTCASASAS